MEVTILILPSGTCAAFVTSFYSRRFSRSWKISCELYVRPKDFYGVRESSNSKHLFVLLWPFPVRPVSLWLHLNTEISFFRGKKLANSVFYRVRKFFCFCILLAIWDTSDSGSITFSIGPKDKIRINTSRSSRGSYQRVTLYFPFSS